MSRHTIITIYRVLLLIALFPLIGISGWLIYNFRPIIVIETTAEWYISTLLGLNVFTGILAYAFLAFDLFAPIYHTAGPIRWSIVLIPTVIILILLWSTIGDMARDNPWIILQIGIIGVFVVWYRGESNRWEDSSSFRLVGFVALLILLGVVSRGIVGQVGTPLPRERYELDDITGLIIVLSLYGTGYLLWGMTALISVALVRLSTKARILSALMITAILGTAGMFIGSTLVGGILAVSFIVLFFMHNSLPETATSTPDHRS
jgi:hypothetical protein